MAWIWIWMTKIPGVAFYGNFSSYLVGGSWYNHFRSFSMGGNGNNTIYPLLSLGRSQRHFIKVYSLTLHMKSFGPKKFKFHAWIKKCYFGNFTRNWLIGWIGHALLVQQPSISAHRKLPEMVVVSASTNQLWTKITIRNYAWSFAHSDPDPDPSSVRCNQSITY